MEQQEQRSLPVSTSCLGSHPPASERVQRRTAYKARAYGDTPHEPHSATHRGGPPSHVAHPSQVVATCPRPISRAPPSNIHNSHMYPIITDFLHAHAARTVTSSPALQYHLASTTHRYPCIVVHIPPSEISHPCPCSKSHRTPCTDSAL